MQLKQVKDFVLEVLKVHPSKVVTRRNGWVNIPCPLAEWNHGTGRDSNPSFGISHGHDTVSIGHCYTCKFKRPLSVLLQTLADHTGKDYETTIELLKTEEFLGGELLSWDELHEHDQEDRLDESKAIPDGVWDIYDTAEGHWYLNKRQIDNTTVREMNLMVDYADSEGEERILFPVFAPDGKCYGMSGRAVNDSARIKARDYQGLDKRLLLLGGHRVARDINQVEYVVIVEGLFDVARLVQYGLYPVGVMHSTLTEAQADIVIGFGKPVILMYDRDAAGRDGVKDASHKLSPHLPVFTVSYPRRFVRNKDGMKELVKDPDQLTYDEVMEMIQHKELVL